MSVCVLDVWIGMYERALALAYEQTETLLPRDRLHGQLAADAQGPLKLGGPRFPSVIRWLVAAARWKDPQGAMSSEVSGLRSARLRVDAARS